MPELPRAPRGGKVPPSAHLRIVRPSPPPAPKGRRRERRPRVFTPEEAARLRAALRTARVLFGGWACAAAALHVSVETLRLAASGRGPVSAETAVRLAKALGKPLDALIQPPTDASRCPSCGRGST